MHVGRTSALERNSREARDTSSDYGKQTAIDGRTSRSWVPAHVSSAFHQSCCADHLFGGACHHHRRPAPARRARRARRGGRRPAMGRAGGLVELPPPRAAVVLEFSSPSAGVSALGGRGEGAARWIAAQRAGARAVERGQALSPGPRCATALRSCRRSG